MPEWEADIEVDEALVRALIAEQFPRLDARSVRLVGEGFDNSVWLIDEEWAFRFPRRANAVHLVSRELDVLPRLAPMLPIPVPVPAFVGTPSARFERPFFGHRLLPGCEPAYLTLTDDDRVLLGSQLGRFLRALHAPEMRALVDPADALPVDPNRRADMPARVQIARRWLGELASLERLRTARQVDVLFEAALELPPADGDAVVHGDLHSRHVLVDGATLSGVIDWGDVCRADPAVDLALVWSFLPAAGRQAFAREYGSIGEAQALRARVLALALCAALASYGTHVGNASLVRESVDGLERTLVG